MSRGPAVYRIPGAPFDPQRTKSLLEAARGYEFLSRESGRPAGALGHVALELLQELLWLADPETGRVAASVETLKARCKRSTGAVVAALHSLRAAGFIERAPYARLLDE